MSKFAMKYGPVFARVILAAVIKALLDRYGDDLERTVKALAKKYGIPTKEALKLVRAFA